MDASRRLPAGRLAKELTGVRLVAGASRPASREWVEGLGGDAMVGHSSDDLAERILAERR